MARPFQTGDAGASGTDFAYGAVRIAVGSVLIWGALTKLLAGERIGELSAAWEAAGLPQPQLLVTMSVGLQLILGMLLLVGMFTRTAGLLNGVNFAAAAAISGVLTSGSHWWAFALLVLLMLHFGVAGGGKLSVDEVRARRVRAQSLEEIMTSLGIKPSRGDGNYPG